MGKTLKKSNKGITLIALVITIVLLILAAVSIATLTGENGILTRAEEAKINSELAKVQEALNLKISQMQSDSYVTSGQRTNVTIEQVEGLAKLVRVNDEEKDIYIVQDLSKIGTSSTIGNGTITSTDTIDSLSDLSDVFIIDQAKKVFYIGSKVYGEGEIDGFKRVIGSSKDWLVDGDKLVKYLGTLNEDTNIIIPNYVDDTKITTIGEGIFKNANTTGTLTMSEGIEVIEDYAFYGSKFTGSLTIPNSVNSIGRFAFSWCGGFTGSLAIPDCVTTIGEQSFSSCSGFTGSLTIPDGVTTIGKQSFFNCSGFTGDLIIPDSVISIGDSAFMRCSGFTGDLIIPDSVISIGDAAFGGCRGLTGNLKIGKGLETFTSYTAIFGGCGFTKDLIIDVQQIGEGAFYNSEISFTGNLIIGENVKTIGDGAFSNCSGFEGTLTIGNNVQTIGRSAFQYCSGFKGTLTIGNSVQSIGMQAFYYCSGFSGDLIIGNGVQSLGKGAFEDCSGFTGNLTIDMETIPSGASPGEYIPKSCKGKLIVGDNVKTIESGAFYGAQFSSATISSSVQEIGEEAFANSNTTVTIKKGTTLSTNSTNYPWGATSLIFEQ